MQKTKVMSHNERNIKIAMQMGFDLTAEWAQNTGTAWKDFKVTRTMTSWQNKGLQLKF